MDIVHPTIRPSYPTWKPITDMDRTLNIWLTTFNNVHTNKIHLIYYPKISVHYMTILGRFSKNNCGTWTHPPLPLLSQIFVKKKLLCKAPYKAICLNLSPHRPVFLLWWWRWLFMFRVVLVVLSLAVHPASPVYRAVRPRRLPGGTTSFPNWNIWSFMAMWATSQKICHSF